MTGVTRLRKLKEDGFVTHTIKKELFELGVCTRETTFGNDVRTYNMERTICDILRIEIIKIQLL